MHPLPRPRPHFSSSPPHLFIAALAMASRQSVHSTGRQSGIWNHRQQRFHHRLSFTLAFVRGCRDNLSSHTHTHQDKPKAREANPPPNSLVPQNVKGFGEYAQAMITSCSPLSTISTRRLVVCKRAAPSLLAHHRHERRPLRRVQL